jgi:transposase InsO family protein
VLLDIAGLSKQAYYYVIKHCEDKDKKDKFYEDLIIKIFNKNYQKYGVLRLTDALNIELAKQGVPKANHKRVERIMKKLGIQARPKQRKYVSYKGDFGKKCKNLLLDKNLLEEKNLYVYKRNFETTGPYQKLGTDVTVFIMPFGKLYLSPIIDFHTREILAYNLSEHPDFRQIDKMFKQLENKHGNKIKGAILHSDMGWQYQMQKYQDKLIKLEIMQSMSRKGNCLDNSPTENFFGRMKEEMFYDKEYLYKDMDTLIKSIVKYIDYYNEERIVNKFHMSPIMYKTKLLETRMI